MSALTAIISFVPKINAVDLFKHIPDNNDWIQAYAQSMGWDKLTAYYDKVWLMLYEMQPGHTFRVLEEVKPDNYDLFIKCVVAALEEFRSYGIGNYHIEEQGTVILRR